MVSFIIVLFCFTVMLCTVESFRTVHLAITPPAASGCSVHHRSPRNTQHTYRTRRYLQVWGMKRRDASAITTDHSDEKIVAKSKRGSFSWIHKLMAGMPVILRRQEESSEIERTAYLGTASFSSWTNLSNTIRSMVPQRTVAGGNRMSNYTHHRDLALRSDGRTVSVPDEYRISFGNSLNASSYYSISRVLNSICCRADAMDFVNVVGVGITLEALQQLRVDRKPRPSGGIEDQKEIVRIDIYSGLLNLIHYLGTEADGENLARDSVLACMLNDTAFVNSLADIAGYAPSQPLVQNLLLSNPFKFISRDKRNHEIRVKLRNVGTALISGLTRSSSVAGRRIRNDSRLVNVLAKIIDNNTPYPTAISSQLQRDNKGVDVAQEGGLQASVLSSLWGLGSPLISAKLRDKPRRGIRILSLDGGGVRGLVSLTVLKEILKLTQQRGRSRGESWFRKLFKKNNVGSEVCSGDLGDHFDIICGTSTGGVIAALIGLSRMNVDEVDEAYRNYVAEVFSGGSNYRLLSSQSYYSESIFEELLSRYFGDQMLLHGKNHSGPRVFMVSTKCNSIPPIAHLWRNYDVPDPETGIRHYSGDCRAKIRDAIRATSAAPTFFGPMKTKGGIHFDGALVANNPTAFAILEAEALFPGVPIDLVVSVGTGTVGSQSNDKTDRFGWNQLLQTMVSTTTDTEDTHRLLSSFMRPKTYFRFNPILPFNVKLDERNQEVISDLNRSLTTYWNNLCTEDPSKCEDLRHVADILLSAN